MKLRYWKLLALAAAGGLLLGTNNARANLEISASVRINAVADFDGPLAADGAWVTVGSFGRCWHPRGVAADWRPYCAGQWVWTDYGWYWQSDEPWAWACYHYGTWTLDPTYGWVWVPGVEWAPAWVVWRSGGGYTGWAPCAPRGVTITANWFAFVGTAHLTDHLRPGALTFRNEAIFRKTSLLKAATRETRNIGGHSERMVINRGPGVADFQKSSGHELKPISVQEAHGRTRIPDAVMHPAPAGHSAPAFNGGDSRGPGAEGHHGDEPHDGQSHGPDGFKGKGGKHDP